MTFSWGVVHTVSPLTVIEDGSSNALPVIQSLVDPSSLTVGDMVRVELAQGGRVVVYGHPGGDPRVGVNEGDIALLNSLPDPVNEQYTTAGTTVSATSWGTDIGNIDNITIVFAQDCWVRIDYSAWMSAGNLRISAAVTGATALDEVEPNGYSGVMWESSGYHQHSGYKVVKVNAGSNVFHLRGMKTSGLNYSNYTGFTVTPLRWA